MRSCNSVLVECEHCLRRPLRSRSMRKGERIGEARP